MITSFILALSIISTCIAKFRHKISVKHDVILLVLSFFTSISWFVLAKGHSYVHPFFNYILLYAVLVPAALYIFMRQRIVINIPDSEKRCALMDANKSLVKKIFFM